MKENFMSGIDEGRQDKLCEACLLLYSVFSYAVPNSTPRDIPSSLGNF